MSKPICIYLGVTPAPSVTLACPSHQFQCKNTAVTQCINKKWVCDGRRDCYDDSDEPEGCSKNSY